jgi:hypothetical protein
LAPPRHARCTLARAGSAIGVFWLLGIILQAAAVGPATKLIWFKFQSAWHLPALTTSTCFALEYAGPGSLALPT